MQLERRTVTLGSLTIDLLCGLLKFNSYGVACAKEHTASMKPFSEPSVPTVDAGRSHALMGKGVLYAYAN